jgi:hypothetical protein
MIPCARNPRRFLDGINGRESIHIKSVPFRHNGHHLKLNTHFLCMQKQENNFISSGVFIFNIREIRIKNVPVCLFVLEQKKITSKCLNRGCPPPPCLFAMRWGWFFLSTIAFDGKKGLRRNNEMRILYLCYHLICLSCLQAAPLARYSRMPFVECGVLKSN